MDIKGYNINLFGELTFPNEKKIITNSEFMGNKYISKVFINKNIEKIEDYAFAQCVNLSEIIFEDGCALDMISYACFKDCQKLNYINFWPQNIKIVKDFAFYNCSNLKQIPIFPNGSLRIEAHTFDRCALNTIDFKCNELDLIGLNELFIGCDNIVTKDKAYIAEDWHIGERICIISDVDSEKFMLKKGLKIIDLLNNNSNFLYYYYDKSAHVGDIGITAKDARQSVISNLKHDVSNRATNEKWTLDTEISCSDIVVITQNCFYGAKLFADINNYDFNKKYKISYIIDELKDVMGYDKFIDFLKLNNII